MSADISGRFYEMWRGYGCAWSRRKNQRLVYRWLRNQGARARSQAHNRLVYRDRVLTVTHEAAA